MWYIIVITDLEVFVTIENFFLWWWSHWKILIRDLSSNGHLNEVAHSIVVEGQARDPRYCTIWPFLIPVRWRRQLIFRLVILLLLLLMVDRSCCRDHVKRLRSIYRSKRRAFILFIRHHLLWVEATIFIWRTLWITFSFHITLEVKYTFLSFFLCHLIMWKIWNLWVALWIIKFAHFRSLFLNRLITAIITHSIFDFKLFIDIQSKS